MKRLVVAGAALTLASLAGAADGPAPLPDASASSLPRWRGFNLLEKFHQGFSNGPFREEDFRLIAKLGFNFVRLPIDYRVWIKDGDWTRLDESVLREVDQAVAWGKQYGIHVCLNFHRAPGYTVALPKERLSLWTDGEAQRVCALHWAAFARRYREIPSRNLSFNLFNEPSDVAPAVYAKVVKQMVEAIHAEDPERLIIADGLGYGRTPVPGLLPLGVAQSTRGYEPMGLTHYCADWVKGSDAWAVPSWPLERVSAKGVRSVTDREALRRQAIEPWLALRAKGVGIHVGEWGAHNRTPHAVVLAWMRDCLENWKEARMGWALWNFRGSFGVLDSQRADVKYEPFEGHQLDRKMLELLQAW